MTSQTLESPRYQLNDYEEMMAACVGHAYKAAQVARTNSEARVDGVWDLKDRMVVEMRLMRPTFNSDVFSERVQYWFERATGY